MPKLKADVRVYCLDASYWTEQDHCRVVVYSAKVHSHGSHLGKQIRGPAECGNSEPAKPTEASPL